jgi:hypothetical protein
MGVPTDTRTAVGVSVTLLVLVTAGRLAQRARTPHPCQHCTMSASLSNQRNGQTVLLVVQAPCW